MNDFPQLFQFHKEISKENTYKLKVISTFFDLVEYFFPYLEKEEIENFMKNFGHTFYTQMGKKIILLSKS